MYSIDACASLQEVKAKVVTAGQNVKNAQDLILRHWEVRLQEVVKQGGHHIEVHLKGRKRAKTLPAAEPPAELPPLPPPASPPNDEELDEWCHEVIGSDYDEA